MISISILSLFTEQRENQKSSLDCTIRMESLAGECSDSNNNNNNGEESSPTTELSVLPLLQRPFFQELPTPGPALSYDLPDADSFVADETFMETMTGEHGFSSLAARKALYWTKNESLESGNITLL